MILERWCSLLLLLADRLSHKKLVVINFMIERFSLLRNTGQFDSVTPPVGIAFTPFSLIYAENGRGKTTLASIFRSLATGDTSLVMDRKRLGAQHDPHIVVDQGGVQSVFHNGAWSRTVPDIAIYDDSFVAENICSGIELQTSHRQNLHELILGSQGVALSNALKGHVSRVEQHNVDLRAKGDAIPAIAKGPLTINAFCNLQEDPDIDEKIQGAERRLAAAKAADAIRQRPVFSELSLPDFDTAEIDLVLETTLDGLDVDAATRVREHIASIGKGGEAWVSEGMPRILSVEYEHDGEYCPFCSQDLGGSDVIGLYRQYFSEAYSTLKTTIRQTGIGLRDTHGQEVPAAFERSIRTTVQNFEFWKSFAELPELEIDTASIARDWTAAREVVLEHLRAKAAAPLEPMSLTPGALAAVQAYRVRIAEVAGISGSLVGCNALLDVVKEQAAADDLAALTSDLDKLKAQNARYEPANVRLCGAYLTEKAAKTTTERLRDQARNDLDQYRRHIFPTYETAINDYLRRFAASFRIAEVQSVNSRAGSSASYCVVINNQNVNITADTGPTFKNTLSAGDRNALALAFFFASLEHDPNLAQKIVVIDDPMTSLDEHRRLRTRQEMRALQGRVSQMIVLSHSKQFLCALWENSDSNVRSAVRINRVGTSSELSEWDIRNDSISEHDKRHELVRSYLHAAEPAIEREVAAALRPIMEAFSRVAFPQHFPPGTLLGPFHHRCQQQIGTADEILTTIDTTELRALLDYANRFHHDSNPAWETEVINDAELTDFAERTLDFASKP